MEMDSMPIRCFVILTVSGTFLRCGCLDKTLTTPSMSQNVIIRSSSFSFLAAAAETEDQ